jgi:hypothetical protein
MKLNRQSKMRVLLVSVFFSWSSINMPGSARHALAEDQATQSEQVIEVSSEITNTAIQLPADQQIKSEELTEQQPQPQVSTEQSTRSDESVQASGNQVKWTVPMVIVGILLASLCLVPDPRVNLCVWFLVNRAFNH